MNKNWRAVMIHQKYRELKKLKESELAILAEAKRIQSFGPEDFSHSFAKPNIQKNQQGHPTTSLANHSENYTLGIVAALATLILLTLAFI